VRVIPYGLGFDETRTATLPQRGTTRDGSFNILFVGNLIERKGVQHLIDALSRLPARIGAKLVVLGEGPQQSRLEAQVRRLGLESRVTMPGRVPEEELHRAFAAAHVLVLPSVVDARGDTEGLGVVLLEGMSYGIPVIGSNVGGITDIVTDGKTGILVPPGDPGAIAAALERLATDPTFAGRLAETGSRHVRSHFSWAAIVDAWQACYAAAVESRE
jgi:glycosyltransferase involved in cell wall biosynthesis